jgi:putative peptidoglycan lipid II flippase
MESSAPRGGSRPAGEAQAAAAPQSSAPAPALAAGDSIAESGAGAAIVERHRGLVSRAALVSGFTLLSRVLGMLRETWTSALLGDSSAVGDALTTAWRLPNLFRRLLGEGALSTSLQTALTEADHEGGNAAGRQLFRETLRLATIVLLGVCAAAMGLVLLVPERMPFFGWNLLGQDPEALRQLSLQLLPFLVFVCLSALIAGALQVRGEYTSSNLAPILLNVVWVAVLGALGWQSGLFSGGAASELSRDEQLALAHTLGWATLAAGVLQVLVQLPALKRHGLWVFDRAREPASRAAQRARGVFRDSVPLALGAAVYQINVTVDGLMANSMLREGGALAYNNATRVQQLPMGLVAVAATSAVFPAFKALGHVGKLRELRLLHDRTQMAIAFVALPASIALAALAGPISELLFLHGRYGPEGVERVSASLRLLALVVLPAGAQGLLSRAHYALGDFRTPVRVSLALFALNVPLNVLCVRAFGMDADGLALATVVTSWVGVAALQPGLRRALGPAEASERYGRRLLALVAAALLSSAAALGTHALFGLQPGEGSGPRGALALGAAIAVGIGAYLALAQLARAPEWTHLRERWAARRARRAA